MENIIQNQNVITLTSLASGAKKAQPEKLQSGYKHTGNKRSTSALTGAPEATHSSDHKGHKDRKGPQCSRLHARDRRLLAMIREIDRDKTIKPSSDQR